MATLSQAPASFFCLSFAFKASPKIPWFLPCSQVDLANWIQQPNPKAPQSLTVSHVSKSLETHLRTGDGVESWADGKEPRAIAMVTPGS